MVAQLAVCSHSKRKALGSSSSRATIFSSSVTQSQPISICLHKIIKGVGRWSLVVFSAWCSTDLDYSRARALYTVLTGCACEHNLDIFSCQFKVFYISCSLLLEAVSIWTVKMVHDSSLIWLVGCIIVLRPR